MPTDGDLSLTIYDPFTTCPSMTAIKALRQDGELGRDLHREYSLPGSGLKFYTGHTPPGQGGLSAVRMTSRRTRFFRVAAVVALIYAFFAPRRQLLIPDILGEYRSERPR